MTAKTKLSNPKVSIVIPAYNASRFLSQTLDNILEQTYKNIEVIIVNDKSTDDSLKIMRRYEKKYENVTVLNLEQNVGPYHGRILGSELATGEFLAFIDSDDLLTVDYIRSMVFKAQENNSDLVISTTVADDNALNERYLYSLAADLPFEYLEDDDCLSAIMDQRGNNYMWHVVTNKLVRASLWNKALPHYKKITEHLIMCDDIALSVPLWHFANRVDKMTTAHYFYRIANDESATAVGKMPLSKAEKNIADLHLAFNFLQSFLQDQGVYEKYQDQFTTWKQVYAKIWDKNISDSSLSGSEKKIVYGLIEEFAPYDKEDRTLEVHFYDIRTPWNDGLEAVKKKIIDPAISCVSFDIFDTLITRPFYKPDDIFKLLNGKFKELCPNHTILTFHDIRRRSEVEARIRHSEQHDISLQQIYEVMSSVYGIDKSVADKMLGFEIEYEIRFCSVRQSARELFELAKYLNKTIILTSDMYLPTEVIESILTSTGYEGWDALYISSGVNKSKAKGSFYPHIIDILKVKPTSILHIGDNPITDIENARKAGLSTAHFPSAISCLYSNGFATKMFENITGSMTGYIGQEYFGIGTFLAMVASKFFDNPFASFNQDSSFNASPSMMGYFALGMHMYGTADWLLEASLREEYDNLVFCARDGFLPLKAFEILSNGASEQKPKTHYLPTSRKAILPLSIFDKNDFNHLDKFTNLKNKTFGDVLNYLGDIIDEKKLSKAMGDYGFSKRTPCKKIDYFDLTNTLKLSVDKVKLKNLHSSFRTYFKPYFQGKTAVFDIGYSAKPEVVLAREFNKPIDVYFTHTYAEGAYRAKTTDNVRLFNFYNFSPFITGGLRELVISELSPSCVRYTPTATGDLEIVYEDSFKVGYYEKFIIETMQKYALQFIQDVSEIFHDHISELVFTNQYISLPIEAIISTPAPADAAVFRPIAFEDDMGIGRVSDITSIIPSQSQRLADILHSRNKLEKLFTYAVLDRGYLVGKLKNKINTRTQRYPLINKSLQTTYKAVRKVKRKIKR